MKKVLSLITAIFFLFVLTGCSTGTEDSSAATDVETMSGSTTYPIDVEDMYGTVEIEKVPEKIVSLSPSNTETLFALDVGDKLVGRTDYDNYPPDAANVASIGSYASPSVEQILSKSPDLVVASDFIDETIKSQLEATGAKVLVFDPASVADTEEYIVTLGEIVDKNDKAKEIVDGMQSKLKEVTEKASEISEPKSVFLDIGEFYTAGPGSLLNDELDLIGANNIAADSDSPYPQLSTEAIISADPDVYISFTESVEELKKVPGFDALKAFKDDQVYAYAADSVEADVVKRPGPRIVDGVELLAKDIYPDIFK